MPARILRKRRIMRHITRTVWLLSLISFFTDAASEMLYPVMPIYLKTVGFSVILIGLLEGLAEAAAGLSKGWFGKQSDLSGRRALFVQLGYGCSALAKPLLALSAAPLWIFCARTLDRLGKGIRTGARDAILAEESTPQTKGRVFGFHRAFDTLGAVAGPLLALAYLHFRPQDYRSLFLAAFIPGLLAICAALLLKDKAKPAPQPAKEGASFFAFLRYWRESHAEYRRVTAGLLFFTLFNSSDMFLLLKAKESGLNDSSVILLYVFYNLIYAAAALPLGILADKLGLKTVFTAGLALFAVVYFGISSAAGLPMLFALFFLYGLYAAATEGVIKAWIAAIADKKDIATASGLCASLQSVCTMLASPLAGLIWFRFGSAAALRTVAAAAVLSALYFIFVPKSPAQGAAA